MKIAIYIFVILLIVGYGTAPADEFKNVGHSGANFLQIPVDAAGAAMGNSYVAMAHGVSGLYWNPAAIHLSEGTEVQLSAANWILDTRIANLGITHHLGRYGTVGIAISSFTMDEMEITTESNPNGTGQYFDAGNFAGGISYAVSFTDQFIFGVSAKYVHEYIWDASSGAFAFDFGSMFRVPDFYDMRLGITILNFGGTLNMSGAPIDERLEEEAEAGIPNNPRSQRLADTYSLPQIFEVGIAFDPYIEPDRHRFTVTATANDPNDNQTRSSFGLEYAFREMIMLRGGFKIGYDEQNLSLGLGTRLEIAGILTHLDYAYVDFGIFSDMHFLTFRVQF
jgi:hypothetical protein